jgi:hypothetical protein
MRIGIYPERFSVGLFPESTWLGLTGGFGGRDQETIASNQRRAQIKEVDQLWRFQSE